MGESQSDIKITSMMLRPLVRMIKPPKNKRPVDRRPPLAATPDVSEKTFLFLGGLHRSGTSILHRLMRSHESASGFSQTGAPQDEGQNLQSVFPDAKATGKPGRFAFNPYAHITSQSDIISEENRDKLLREWGVYYDLDKTLLLEKSPPNLLRSCFLQDLVPNSKFVFIVRHPIAVSLATRKWSKTSLIELMLHWYLAHKIMIEDARSLQHVMILRYEDFVSSPTRYLGHICDFSGVDNFEPSETVSDHNGKYLGNIPKEFMDELVLLKERFPEVVELVERMHYSLDLPYVTTLPHREFLTVGDL